MDSLKRWISQVLLYFTDVTCTSASKGHFSFAVDLLLFICTWILFCSCSAFLSELLYLQVHLRRNGYMCCDVSYSKPKEMKPPLVNCIDFPLPTKVNFKAIAICRKTQGRIPGGWLSRLSWIAVTFDRYPRRRLCKEMLNCQAFIKNNLLKITEWLLTISQSTENTNIFARISPRELKSKAFLWIDSPF